MTCTTPSESFQHWYWCWYYDRGSNSVSKSEKMEPVTKQNEVNKMARAHVKPTYVWCDTQFAPCDLKELNNLNVGIIG